MSFVSMAVFSDKKLSLIIYYTEKGKSHASTFTKAIISSLHNPGY